MGANRLTAGWLPSFLLLLGSLAPARVPPLQTGPVNITPLPDDRARVETLSITVRETYLGYTRTPYDASFSWRASTTPDRGGGTLVAAEVTRVAVAMEVGVGALGDQARVDSAADPTIVRAPGGVELRIPLAMVGQSFEYAVGPRGHARVSGWIQAADAAARDLPGHGGSGSWPWAEVPPEETVRDVLTSAYGSLPWGTVYVGDWWERDAFYRWGAASILCPERLVFAGTHPLALGGSSDVPDALRIDLGGVPDTGWRAASRSIVSAEATGETFVSADGSRLLLHRKAYRFEFSHRYGPNEYLAIQMEFRIERTQGQ